MENNNISKPNRPKATVNNSPNQGDSGKGKTGNKKFNKGSFGKKKPSNYKYGKAKGQNNLNRRYNKYNKKVMPGETREDIQNDIAQIEKEIELEISEITNQAL